MIEKRKFGPRWRTRVLLLREGRYLAGNRPCGERNARIDFGATPESRDVNVYLEHYDDDRVWRVVEQKVHRSNLIRLA